MQIGETAHGLALMWPCCSQKFRHCAARHRSHIAGSLHSIPIGVRMIGKAEASIRRGAKHPRPQIRSLHYQMWKKANDVKGKEHLDTECRRTDCELCAHADRA